jgi:hypothetical protein
MNSDCLASKISDLTNSRSRILAFLILAIAAVVLLACSAFFVWFYALDGPTLQHGQEAARELVVGLERYNQKTGHYPSNLDELVPDQLSVLPRAAWRYPYYYWHNAPLTSYMIFFRLRGSADDWCCYSSKTEVWECHDSYPYCDF